MILSLVIVYLLVLCYFGRNWLNFNRQHSNCTLEEQFLSFVMVIIIVLWPIALVSYCLQNFKKRKFFLNSFTR